MTEEKEEMEFKVVKPDPIINRRMKRNFKRLVKQEKRLSRKNQKGAFGKVKNRPI